MIYDLAVVGNGIAAQTFLWSLSEKFTADEKKSQIFSIAHIYSEKNMPACTLRSMATVSLNGVSESAQGLGEDLRTAYHKFVDFNQKFSPDGITPIKQQHFYTNEKDQGKMLRRFSTLVPLTHEKIKDNYRDGAEVDSFMIQTEVFTEWLKDHTKLNKNDFPLFFKNLTMDKDGLFELHLEDQSIIKARKVVLAMGAYSKIYAHFYKCDEINFDEDQNIIKGGTYLEREVDLGAESFLFVIDMMKVMYKADEKKLLIGAVTTIGPVAPPLSDLSQLLIKIQAVVNFSVGKLSDYKIVTGLRHKGPRRKFIAEKMSETKEIYRINGFYKNGFTLNFLAAEKLLKEMNL